MARSAHRAGPTQATEEAPDRRIGIGLDARRVRPHAGRRRPQRFGSRPVTQEPGPGWRRSLRRGAPRPRHRPHSKNRPRPRPQRRRQSIAQRRTSATAHRSTVLAGRVPSDPRPSILPRGGAGWPVRGDQERKVRQDLAFGTGPKNASVLSSSYAAEPLGGKLSWANSPNASPAAAS